MRTAALAALLGAAAVSACGGQSPAPFKPVADTKLLMQSVVDPGADVIWSAVKTIETTAGRQEIRPTTDADWTAIRNAAVTVTESGNLLMMAPRAKDGAEWTQRALEMIAAGEAAMHAAEARNPDRLFAAGGDLYDSCSNCHRKYVEPIVNANR